MTAIGQKSEMNRFRTVHMKRTRNHQPHGVTGLLALAASPVCGLMAWITVNDGVAMAFCGSAPGMASIGSMSVMYLLMSLFHLPPWLRLVSGRLWDRTLSNIEGDGS